MNNLTDRTRLLAFALVGIFFIAASGAVSNLDGRLLLGVVNDGGTASTVLRARSDVDGFAVMQVGGGSAVRGSSLAGAAGQFSSGQGAGVIGVSESPDGYGVIASTTSTTTGTGAAVKADGRQNSGLVATSSNGSAVVATAYGDASAVKVLAPNATAIRAATTGGGDVADCSAVMCAGTELTGAIGVIAATSTDEGSGVYATDLTSKRSGFAVLADGAVGVDGALSVTGGCLGCSTMVPARNGSSAILHQGEAVTLVKVDATPDGSTLLVIRPALNGERVIGVIDHEAVLVAAPAGATTMHGGWQIGGVETPAGSMARLATDGLLTLDQPIAGVEQGDQVVVGPTAGILVPAGDTSEGIVGTYLGTRPDGRGVLLIDIG